MWCGNIAGGTVPVPYRYDTVRYMVGKDFGTLRAGCGNASGTGTGAGTIYVPFWLAMDDSEWYSIVRCVEVHDWYCCGLIALLVSLFGRESLVCV